MAGRGRGGAKVGPAGRPEDPGFGSALAGVANDATTKSTPAAMNDAALFDDRRKRWCCTCGRPPSRFGDTGALPVSLLPDACSWLSRVNLDRRAGRRRLSGSVSRVRGDEEAWAAQKAIHFGVDAKVRGSEASSSVKSTAGRCWGAATGRCCVPADMGQTWCPWVSEWTRRRTDDEDARRVGRYRRSPWRRRPAQRSSWLRSHDRVGPRRR